MGHYVPGEDSRFWSMLTKKSTTIYDISPTFKCMCSFSMRPFLYTSVGNAARAAEREREREREREKEDTKEKEGGEGAAGETI